MSTTAPDQRPALPALSPGDSIAAASISAAYRGMDRDGFARVLGAIIRRLGKRFPDGRPHDIVILAVPAGKGAAVQQAIEPFVDQAAERDRAVRERAAA